MMRLRVGQTWEATWEAKERIGQKCGQMRLWASW